MVDKDLAFVPQPVLVPKSELFGNYKVERNKPKTVLNQIRESESNPSSDSKINRLIDDAF